jgi:hypothetical protein
MTESFERFTSEVSVDVEERQRRMLFEEEFRRGRAVAVRHFTKKGTDIFKLDLTTPGSWQCSEVEVKWHEKKQRSYACITLTAIEDTTRGQTWKTKGETAKRSRGGRTPWPTSTFRFFLIGERRASRHDSCGNDDAYR